MSIYSEADKQFDLKNCLWFLTSLISIVHFTLKLIPSSFSYGSPLHASSESQILKTVNCLCTFGGYPSIDDLVSFRCGKIFGLWSKSFGISSCTGNAKNLAHLPLLWLYLISSKFVKSNFHTSTRPEIPNFLHVEQDSGGMVTVFQELQMWDSLKLLI